MFYLPDDLTRKYWTCRSKTFQEI